MILANWALLGYAFYVPLLIGLYLLELIVTFQLRKKSSDPTFYKIFSASAVVNIAACVLGSFVFRAPLYPLINGFYSSLRISSALLNAANSCAYYLNVLSDFLNLMMAFNRFTALFCTVNHAKFWCWALPIGCLICVVAAIPPVWNLITDVTMIYEIDNTFVGHKYYYIDTVVHSPQGSLWLKLVTVTAASCILSSLLYGACLVRLCRYSAKRNYTVERNLFLVGFVTLLCSLPYMGAMLVFYFNLAVADAVADVNLLRCLAYQLPWLFDLKHLIPAVMLLVTNRPVRSSICRIIGVKAATVVPVYVVPLNNMMPASTEQDAAGRI